MNHLEGWRATPAPEVLAEHLLALSQSPHVQHGQGRLLQHVKAVLEQIPAAPSLASEMIERLKEAAWIPKWTTAGRLTIGKTLSEAMQPTTTAVSLDLG